MTKKTVVITGAANGIGLAIAKSFVEIGYNVGILDVQRDAIDKALAVLNAEKPSATGYICNVTDEGRVSEVLKDINDTYGRIDVLINNAGLQYVAPIADFPTEKFRLLLDVMLTAPFIAIKHVLPYMKQRKFGRIINMASINGLIGFAGKAAYNSAKHGVIGLTKVAALETASEGITVNAVCPGYVDTDLVRRQLADIASSRGIEVERVLSEVIYPLVPQKRLLQVDEIAAMLLYLCSEQAGGITGQALVIDGGYTAQ